MLEPENKRIRESVYIYAGQAIFSQFPKVNKIIADETDKIIMDSHLWVIVCEQLEEQIHGT